MCPVQNEGPDGESFNKYTVAFMGTMLYNINLHFTLDRAEGKETAP